VIDVEYSWAQFWCSTVARCCRAKPLYSNSAPQPSSSLRSRANAGIVQPRSAPVLGSNARRVSGSTIDSDAYFVPIKSACASYATLPGSGAFEGSRPKFQLFLLHVTASLVQVDLRCGIPGLLSVKISCFALRPPDLLLASLSRSCAGLYAFEIQRYCLDERRSCSSLHPRLTVYLGRDGPLKTRECAQVYAEIYRAPERAGNTFTMAGTMAVPSEIPSIPAQTTGHEAEDSRRAREFYHYFQPDDLMRPQARRRLVVPGVSDQDIPDLSKTLAPIAQLTTLRMGCRKSMINVMDRDMMYFLSEATKIANENHPDSCEFVEDPIFLACSSLPLQGRICEVTIRLNTHEDDSEVPLYVINDLTKSQFAHMEIITGPPHYRFYAGVPITTREGINIGSLAIMDTRVRPDGLSTSEIAFLATTANQIMGFLETNRQAIEGRQSRRMADGLEAFIAGRKSIHEEKTGYTYGNALKKKSRSTYGLAIPINGEPPHAPVKPLNHHAIPVEPVDEVSTSGQSSETDEMSPNPDLEGDSKSHIKTFARAANILRECLGDLGDDGAVAFLNLGTTFHDHRKRGASMSSKITDTIRGEPRLPGTKASFVAYSTKNDNVISEKGLDERLKPVDGEMLKEMIRRYPGGRIFVLDGNAASSSEDETSYLGQQNRVTEHVRKPSRRKQLELAAVRAAFPSAAQVLFAPLWDATTGSFAYACFVAAALESRSFALAIDMPFLNSFCSTLMSECSRLDTIQADRQKSDFVGTISHEMRSPLHGLLASTEFLAETELSGFQRSLISTIDSCGRTLLDTINHVLDFSKINSFQKHWQASNKKHNHSSRRYAFLGPDNTSKTITNGAPALLQLLGVVDVSAVLEEVVDGLVLGHTYNSGLDLTDMSRESRGRGASKSGSSYPDRVKISLDIEKADWVFLTQPGAVRRIIMNITGNAIKYTTKGSIAISLSLQEAQGEKGTESMILTVKDTGKGISQDFLNSKLFVPFAQENALAPGTGLGLSIVRSIVLMLGGTIDVQSELHKGTTVEVNLPLKKPLPGQTSTQATPYSDGTTGPVSIGSSSVDSSLHILRDQWTDAAVTFWQTDREEDSQIRRVVASYVQDWFNLQFVDQRLYESCSVVVVEEKDLEHLLGNLVSTPGRRPALVVMCSVLSKHSAALVHSLEKRIGSAVEFVSEPCGPHKLAHSIQLALEKQVAIVTQSRKFNQHVIAPNRASSYVREPESLAKELADMDLNAPGKNDSGQVVQATETFAVSQASENGQMALHNPITALRTPRNHVSEGESFPFPMQVQENSRMRRESDRRMALDETTNEPPPPSITSPESLRPSPTPISVVQEVNPNVLLVDDNQINLKLLETFLRNKRKYTRIQSAEDGQQAVDAVKCAVQPFDIIFMDISMPVLDGFEATRAIRDFEDGHGTKPGAMVIALTGLASAKDQAEVFSSGCDIYMTKPVSFKEVGKLLNNWEAHRNFNANATPTNG
jgi:signal transduction histidine kinase/CheY-like chemotaxis protein